MKGEVVGDGYWNLLADGARWSWNLPMNLPSSSPYKSVGVGVSGRSAECTKLETVEPVMEAREGEREKAETNDGERESVDEAEGDRSGGGE